MLRNYTLVTGDVDLAKLSDREGVCEGGKGRKRIEEEGGGGDGKVRRRGERGPLGISLGSRGQALVGLLFSWVSLRLEWGSFSHFFPPLVPI